MVSVRTAMQRGALHYLIKPFEFDDLRLRLSAYAELQASRAGARETHQQEVDRLFGLVGRPLRREAPALPKGHSPATAELVLEALRDAAAPLSATDVAERVGISRTTAQRYLATLADAGEVRLNLRLRDRRPPGALLPARPRTLGETGAETTGNAHKPGHGVTGLALRTGR